MSTGVTRWGPGAGQGGFGRASAAILGAGIAIVCAVVVVAAAGGFSSGKSPGAASTATSTPGAGSQVTTTTSRQQALAQLLSDVTVSPASGATAQPGSTVRVQADGAHLDSVVLRVAPVGTDVAAGFTTTTAAGDIAGQLSASHDAWYSTGLVLPSTHYTVAYQVTGPGGLTATGASSFSTAAPAKPVSATIWPSSGLAVGIGQPIQLTFSQPLTSAQQLAMLSHVSVDMSKPVPGGWHWFSDTSLHFRPTNFWPTGEQVQAKVDLDGWDMGGGEWGVGNAESQFVIGNAHVSVANLTTHEMTVYDNGQAIYQWPISAGSPEWPTQDGIHIVLDRTSQVQMISSTVGIPVNSPGGYDETVYWATQISYSGEYVHAAPWSVTEQGYENVSHGCINLSAARAEAFFHFSRVGDIVEVVGGTRPPLITDGGLMDWSFSPSQVPWTPAKVGQLTTTVTTLPTTTEPPPAGAPTTDVPLPTVPPGETLSTLPNLPVTPVPTAPPTTAPPVVTTTLPPATTTTLPPTLPPTTTTTTAPTTVPTTTVPTTTVPTTTVPTTTVPTTTVPTTTTTKVAPATVTTKAVPASG